VLFVFFVVKKRFVEVILLVFRNGDGNGGLWDSWLLLFLPFFTANELLINLTENVFGRKMDISGRFGSGSNRFLIASRHFWTASGHFLTASGHFMKWFEALWNCPEALFNCLGAVGEVVRSTFGVVVFGGAQIPLPRRGGGAAAGVVNSPPVEGCPKGGVV